MSTNLNKGDYAYRRRTRFYQLRHTASELVSRLTWFQGNIVSLSYNISRKMRKKHTITGLCIAYWPKGSSSNIVLRNVLFGVGVEVVFMLYSPLLRNIRVIEFKKSKGYKKAFFLRKKLPRFSRVKSRPID
jgi:ribosomal protein L19